MSLKLNVIIPCYNEKNTIEIIIDKVLNVNIEPHEKKIIVIDDHSNDGSTDILKKYENEGNPYYSSARIWDDGIISPLDTREILIYAFSILKNNPNADIQSPVFRM